MGLFVLCSESPGLGPGFGAAGELGCEQYFSMIPSVMCSGGRRLPLRKEAWFTSHLGHVNASQTLRLLIRHQGRPFWPRVPGTSHREE